MADVFALGKTYQAMEPAEPRKLLHHPAHEVRVGAVSIMDFQARAKKTSAERRQELYDLYMNNHERIDSWSMVDRAAPYVVGGTCGTSHESRCTTWLGRRDRWSGGQPSWRRITSSASTTSRTPSGCRDPRARPGRVGPEAVGGWVREAGKQDLDRLRLYLDEFAATMPRTALRYAVEHLDAYERSRYLGMRGGAA